MKAITTLLYFLFATKNIHSQTKATLIIAGLAKDGIVLAADTRGSIFETTDYKKQPIAYVDSLNKIFFINGFIVTSAGNSMFGNKSIGYVIRQFDAQIDKSFDILQTASLFQQYIASMPEEAHAKNNTFIFVGYKDTVPYIIGFNRQKSIVYNRGGIVSDTGATKYLSYMDKKPRSCKSLGKKFAKTMQQFAEETNQTGSIGGPISIVQMRPNNKVHFISNNFTDREYESAEELFNAIESGKLLIKALVPDGKRKAIEILRPKNK